MVPWSKSSTETEVVEKPEDKEANGTTPQAKKDAIEFPEFCDNEETKESFRLTLGSYKGTIIPLAILFFGYGCGAVAVSPMKADTRVKDWFLMGNSIPSLTISVLYILFTVVWGPNLMKHREPYRLRSVMIVYNAFQVVFSTYMFIEVGLAGWFFEYSIRCQPCDYSWNPKAIRIAGIGWLFFISKIVDFIDTLFFILHKKWVNVSMLHIVHHSCMCISMWYGIKYTPGGHITFMGFLNSGVHAIMYLYYFLAACGPALRPYLWWKKYLTTIQLGQFVLIFLHAAQLLFRECPDVPIGLGLWTCIYAVIFFTLFLDFYYYAYRSPSKKAKAEPVQKGDSTKDQILPSGHIRSRSNLKFRLDSCLCHPISNH